MRINRVIRVHTVLCGTEFTRARWPYLHTATMAPSSDLYFSQPSYCFSSWAETWNTVCSTEKRAHCRWACMPRPFGPHTQGAIVRSSSIRIETTSGSGLGLIWIGSGLGKCAFSVNTLKPDSIRFNAHWVSSVNRPIALGLRPRSFKSLKALQISV